MPSRLNTETIAAIRADVDLYSALCKHLDIKPSSMNNTLSRNNSLTDYDTLKMLSEYTGKETSDLIEEFTESNTAEPTTA